LWEDVKSISAYLIFFYWKFSYEGQNLKMPCISIWFFFWLQIDRWFQKCTKFVVWRSTLNFTGWNWSKFGEIWKFHIFWPYLTSCGWNWNSIFGISEQFAIRKSTISIYRTTSFFDLYENIQSSRPRGLIFEIKFRSL
jgi:hypothetical protein